MQHPAHHIIHRLHLEVDIQRKSTGMEVKEHIKDILIKELLPLLENHLDELEDALGGHYVQIPKMELQLTSHSKIFQSPGSIDIPLVLGQLTGQLKEQLEQKLQQIKFGYIPSNNLGNLDNENSLNLSQKRKPKGNFNGNSQELDGLGSNGKKDNSYHQLSGLDREIITIISILKTGQKPWWVSHNEEQRFFFSWDSYHSIKDILESSTFWNLFLKNIHLPAFKNRLVKQFSNDQLSLIFGSIINHHIGLTTIQKTDILQKLPSKGLLREAYWKIVFGIFDKKRFKESYQKDFNSLFTEACDQLSINRQLLKNHISSLLDIATFFHSEEFTWESKNLEIDQEGAKISTSNQDKKEKESKQNQNKWLDEKDQPEEFQEGESLEIENKALHIDQAGLVILHPFLKTFFQKTGLLEENNQINAPEYAAHLLHYVGTKREKAFEHEMLFEKYCCNIPLDKAINRDIEISNQHKMMAEELLEAVRDHWKALKKTGIDTLRAEFLGRKGKLDLEGDHPKLHLERKTQDILLDQLPWNISMVKFPWKKELLFVEW